jgi:alkylation response protein AidB-like acyl-CoA dehydrogenase
MTEYRAPLRDMRFVLEELAGLEAISALPGCADANPETVGAVLEEAARFAEEVLSPLNASGDRAGCRFTDGAVATPPGWTDAYQRFVDGGWNGLALPPELGGQGLPRLAAAPAMEMVKSANLAFSLAPMLTKSAASALIEHGSETLKRTYGPKLVQGRWAGTMNLTEPQAGSDLALLRARAVPEGDHYRINGQKIFVTYGEHDLTENIVHLVLARTPDAPPGVKGISLFLVPKILVGPDGALGERNDVTCVSIEHKLGIHGSPTAVLAYGERGGAVGYRIGEENRGVEYMFTMMNEARFAVGLEGVALAERAHQQAVAYARERVQGRDLADPAGKAVPIVRHPDVRRMLMTGRALTEANRALAYVVAAAVDLAHRHPEEAARRRHRAFVDFMIPVLKGWATECGVSVAQLGIQVHGGMGYIEETGAAQHLRDARITTIYEGTTGIQAIDLVGRKVARDGGTGARAVATEIRATLSAMGRAGADELATIWAALGRGLRAFESATDWIVVHHQSRPREVYAGAVPFLELAGLVCGGWQMARAALAAVRRRDEGSGDAAFYRAKVATARFYADHLLTRAPALAETIQSGAPGVLALPEEEF